MSVAYRLRRAARDDIAAITGLRNSPEVCAVARRRHALDPHEFERELVASMDGDDSQLLVIDVAQAFGGYIRIEPRPSDGYEIGVAIDRDWRGQGLGTRAISQAAREFHTARPSATLVALIRPDNLASAHAFAAAGFEREGRSGELDVYRYAPVKRVSPGRVLGVVQARVGSTRFPGKVLAPINGVPLLARLLDRLRASARLDAVAVATSSERQDDSIVRLAGDAGFDVVRGPLSDVLERFRLAATTLGADTIVRITGDCPLVDAAIIDLVIERFVETGAAYASNVHPPTFPDGLDVEVIDREALELAAAHATSARDREHVTLYLAERPDRFPFANLSSPTDHSEMRWTVDHPDDLVFVRGVFACFAGAESSFTYAEVLSELERNPELSALMPVHPRNEGPLRAF